MKYIKYTNRCLLAMTISGIAFSNLFTSKAMALGEKNEEPKASVHIPPQQSPEIKEQIPKFDPKKCLKAIKLAIREKMLPGDILEIMLGDSCFNGEVVKAEYLALMIEKYNTELTSNPLEIALENGLWKEICDQARKEKAIEEFAKEGQKKKEDGNKNQVQTITKEFLVSAINKVCSEGGLPNEEFAKEGQKKKENGNKNQVQTITKEFLVSAINKVCSEGGLPKNPFNDNVHPYLLALALKGYVDFSHLEIVHALLQGGLLEEVKKEFQMRSSISNDLQKMKDEENQVQNLGNANKNQKKIEFKHFEIKNPKENSNNASFLDKDLIQKKKEIQKFDPIECFLAIIAAQEGGSLPKDMFSNGVEIDTEALASAIEKHTPRLPRKQLASALTDGLWKEICDYVDQQRSQIFQFKQANKNQNKIEGNEFGISNDLQKMKEIQKIDPIECFLAIKLAILAGILDKDILLYELSVDPKWLASIIEMYNSNLPAKLLEIALKNGLWEKICEESLSIVAINKMNDESKNQDQNLQNANKNEKKIEFKHFELKNLNENSNNASFLNQDLINEQKIMLDPIKPENSKGPGEVFNEADLSDPNFINEQKLIQDSINSRKSKEKMAGKQLADNGSGEMFDDALLSDQKFIDEQERILNGINSGNNTKKMENKEWEELNNALKSKDLKDFIAFLIRDIRLLVNPDPNIGWRDVRDLFNDPSSEWIAKTLRSKIPAFNQFNDLAGFITKFKQAVDKIIEGKPGKDESFNAKEGSLCKKLSDVLKKSNWSSDYEIGLIQLDLFFKQVGSTKDDIKPKDVLAFTLFLLYVDYSFPGKIVDMNMQHEIPHIKRLNCELTEDLIKENVLYFLRAILDFFAVNFQEK